MEVEKNGNKLKSQIGLEKWNDKSLCQWSGEKYPPLS
jgi:hypothetical protein